MRRKRSSEPAASDRRRAGTPRRRETEDRAPHPPAPPALGATKRGSAGPSGAPPQGKAKHRLPRPPDAPRPSRAKRGSAGSPRAAGRARPGAREEALRILLRVSEQGAWASRLLEALDERELDPRDLALVREIVLGTLRWRRTIDDRLQSFCRMPLEQLEPVVKEALRIGAYQLMFLRRVPAHAAVDESVRLVRRRTRRGQASDRTGAGSVGGGAAGLVNAVLRALAASPPSPSRAVSAVAESPGARLRRLSTELSHPEWMVERALRRFGEQEARSCLLANNRPAPVCLRPNPLHPCAGRLAASLLKEGVRTRPGGLAPGALHVLEGRPLRTRLFAEGAFWIQDEASQVVPLLFPPPWDGHTVDLCAAPGGKTFVLATGPPPQECSAAPSREPSVRGEPAPGSGSGGPHAGELDEARGGVIAREQCRGGRVIACELHPHRARRLLEAAGRIAPGRVGVVVGNSASSPPLVRGRLDRVLVDAPCSGTGVLRRHPEIRWRLDPRRLAVLSDLQARLLEAAAELVRPGGYIVYSVCSIEPEEGDQVLEAFLSRPGWRLVDPRGHLPAPAGAAVEDDGRLRTYAHRHGSDGFFAALVRRSGAFG